VRHLRAASARSTTPSPIFSDETVSEVVVSELALAVAAMA
jgi:hypothetical protein